MGLGDEQYLGGLSQTEEREEEVNSGCRNQSGTDGWRLGMVGSHHRW